MEVYKCTSSFKLPVLDEDERMTGQYKEVTEGTIWKCNNSYKDKYIVKLYLEKGNCFFPHIYITIARLKAHFHKITI